MRKTEILFPILMMLSSCSWMNQEVGLNDDNIIEEIFEATIDAKTGFNIDLTPSTPEKLIDNYKLPPFKLGE